MIRTKFAVIYSHWGFITVVLGVTSIVPNLNGFLLFTEDGENHFIEASDFEDDNLEVLGFKYDARAEDYIDSDYLVIDHCKK